MYGILTQKNNGTWDLPVVKTFSRAVQVTVGSITHPRGVWVHWTDAELRKAGLTRIDDATKVPSGKEKSQGFTDAYPGDRVQRTFALVDSSPIALKRKLMGRVNGKREEISQAGVSVTIRGSDYVLQTDLGSQLMLTGSMAAAAAGHSFPAGFAWRMRDNVDVKLNPAEMKAMAGAVFDHVNAAHGAARIHKAAIKALTTWAEIEAYDLEAGWPPVAPPEVTP